MMDAAPSSNSLIHALEAFKTQVCNYSHAGVLHQISYRSSLDAQSMDATQPLGVTHVLLHGIGSGSASWLHQLEYARAQSAQTLTNPSCGQVLAWDAPGYALSSPLSSLSPTPSEYAEQFWAWLDAMESSVGEKLPLTLVGHSLGCLMATAAQAKRPERVKRVVLLAPATGYGAADEALRNAKRDERLQNLNLLGPKGMADKRGHAMLHEPSSLELLNYVKFIMAQVIPEGYAQATRMLSNADLLQELESLGCALSVASGDQDVITPLEGCQRVAAKKNVVHQVFSGAGHACHLQSHREVTELIFTPSLEVKRA
jgi:pimeloyl-ACP methyl ester carboxylesterase